MALEIERKFLVSGDFRPFIEDCKCIKQGYLSIDPDRTVRVRIIDDDEATLTIKGRSGDDGLCRYEWEKYIDVDEAVELMALAIPNSIVDKVRYYVPINELVFEVDEFLGLNSGLVVAELELPSTDYVVTLPDWIGQEVTGDSKYYNSNLMSHPYTMWDNVKIPVE